MQPSFLVLFSLSIAPHVAGCLAPDRAEPRVDAQAPGHSSESDVVEARLSTLLGSSPQVFGIDTYAVGSGDFRVGVLLLVADDANGCFENHHNPLLFGETFDTDVVSCALPELGPYATGTAELFDGKDWRLHVRAAASGGTPDEVATGYVNAQWRDVFTVVAAASEPDAPVPVFIRLRHRRDIQNPPFSFLRFELEVQREFGPTVHYQRDDYETAGENEFERNIAIGTFAPGTRLRVDAALDAVAESGGCCGKLVDGTVVDPKEAEADVSVSLCSAVAGAFLQGASGSTGACTSEGDLILHHAELVQTVSHDPESLQVTDLVSDKPTVMLVDLENTFLEPVDALLETAIEQLGVATTYSIPIRMPASCRKRFYLPDPLGATSESCEVSPTGSTLAEVLMQPLLGAGPVTAFAMISPSVPGAPDENPDNDVFPRPGRQPSPQEVLVTSDLRVSYVRVFCAAGEPCKDDPAGYGDVSDPEYSEAIRWSNIHTRALFPVGPIGFSGEACRYADQSFCEFDGEQEKCVFAPCPGFPEEECARCTGVVRDAKRSFREARYSDPSVDRAVALVPDGYYRYHGLRVGDEFVGGFTPDFYSNSVTVMAAAQAGTTEEFRGSHIPVTPHELGHSFGLEHPPVLAMGGEEFELSTPPAGYWVDCDETLGSASSACEVPELEFDLLGARDLMAKARAGFLEPARRWINTENYEHLLAQIKIDPDPVVLYLDGTVTKERTITIDLMAEFPSGKIDGPPRNSTRPELFTIHSLDRDGNVVSTHRLEGNFRSELEDRRIVNFTLLPFMQSIAFPAETAKLRFTHEGSTLMEVDPLSGILRTAVEKIPDRGFDRNPAERRNALLEKVGAIEKQIAAGARKGAIQKLESDLRNVATKWLVDFQERSRTETTKDDLLAVIDSVIARLEAQSGTPPRAP